MKQCFQLIVAINLNKAEEKLQVFCHSLPLRTNNTDKHPLKWSEYYPETKWPNKKQSKNIASFIIQDKLPRNNTIYSATTIFHDRYNYNLDNSIV